MTLNHTCFNPFLKEEILSVAINKYVCKYYCSYLLSALCNVLRIIHLRQPMFPGYIMLLYCIVTIYGIRKLTGVAKDLLPLEYGPASMGNWLPTFRRNVFSAMSCNKLSTLSCSIQIYLFRNQRRSLVLLETTTIQRFAVARPNRINTSTHIVYPPSSSRVKERIELYICSPLDLHGPF